MINFTYTVIGVNADLHTMEVQYSALNHEIVVMSIPIPYDDQDLVQLIIRCSPQAKWANATKTFQTVPLGLSGAITSADLVTPSVIGSISDSALEAAIQRVLAANNIGTV